MVTSSNYSDIEFGITNNSQRYWWAAYHLLVLISSLLGDTLVLMASLQKDALKVNKFVVTVMQHIAVCDLATAITTVLPGTISFLANSWVLGDGLCYVRAYTYYSFIYIAGMSLIAALTAGKILILKNPLRAANWSATRAHLVCGVIWTSSLTMPILFSVVDKHDVHFDYRFYNCRYKFTNGAWKKIMPIVGLIFGFVPNVVIVVTTIPTLKYLHDARRSARRVRGNVPWQGTVAVALTAVVYCISTLPMTVYVIGVNFVKEEPPGRFRIDFLRTSTFLMMINTMSNFYIYLLTMKSFRTFLFSRVATLTLHSSRPSTSSTGVDKGGRTVENRNAQINEAHATSQC